MGKPSVLGKPRRVSHPHWLSQEGSLCSIMETSTNSARLEHRNPALAIALRQEKDFLKARMELRELKLYFLMFQKFLKVLVKQQPIFSSKA